jgi:bla regulator protein BlaR1
MITAYPSAAWIAILPALGNHLWQSTLFAGVAGGLALSMRNNQARVRYALWLAASVKFLVPFALLVSAGNYMAWPSEASGRAFQFSFVVQQASQPFVAERGFGSVVAPAAGPSAPVVGALVLALWFAGFLGIVFSWWVRWRRIGATVRAAIPLREGPEAEAMLYVQRRIGVRKRVQLMSTASPLEPGILGIFRPILLLPADIACHLGSTHFEAVLAHELCHVRRRDNLASAIHMVVEAVFWFHPLVWWIGARLVDERERACDEDVLQLGNDPEVYAESVLKTCQYYLDSPLACMSGITGSDLKSRIVRIMTEGVAKSLSPGRRLLLATAGIVAVSGPIVLGILNAPQSRAQTPAANSAGAPKFEVASIKPSSGSGPFRIALQPSGRFMANNITVKFLLEQAYGLKDSQISGAPGWLDSEYYDIEAKPDDVFVQQTLNRDERFQQITLILQSMLRERFKLTLRHETKELPVYALVVAKNGPKLKEAAPAPPDSEPVAPGTPGGQLRRGGIQMRPGQLAGASVPLDRVADVLSRLVGRVVVDKTALKGLYDFTLNWTPGEGEGPMFRGAGDPGAGGPPREAGPPPDASGPTIFSAVEEQLGLKLESRKSLVETIRIEHVEKPSEN